MNDNTILQLNILLRKNYDSLKYYQRAAELAENVTMHEFFNRKANERYVFGNQIKKEIKHLNGHVFENEELEHLKIQGWFNFNKKHSSQDYDFPSLLQKCEQAELKCLEDYKKILEYPSLPESTKQLLKEQHNVISGFRWNVQLNILLSQFENNSFLDQ